MTPEGWKETEAGLLLWPDSCARVHSMNAARRIPGIALAHSFCTDMLHLAAFRQVCVAIRQPAVIRQFLQRFVRRVEWRIWCLSPSAGLFCCPKWRWPMSRFSRRSVCRVLLLFSHSCSHGSGDCLDQKIGKRGSGPAFTMSAPTRWPTDLRHLVEKHFERPISRSA